MAKKRQFKGAKFKDGILSYNYLGGKGGKGGGDVSIKKIDDDWYFVDDKGEVRDALGNGGKLTPTHMQNLRDDGIFDAVKVDSNTGKETGGNVGIDSDGNLSDGSASVQSTPLAESNYELPGEMSAPVSKAQKAFTPGDPAAGSSSQITASTENAPPTLQSGWGGETARYNKKMIDSGYSENTPYIPDSVSLPDQTMTGSPHGSEWELPTRNIHGETQSPYGRGDTFHQTSLGNQTSSNTFTPSQELAGQNEFTGFGQDRMSGPSYGATPSYQRSFSSDPAALDTGTLDIGTGGEGSMWDSSFYRTKDGTLMKDSGVFGEDTVATQADIDTGIADQSDSPWGSAAGWQAAGSVMKGVGGLASAYTGFKNYELARDAHDTQKAQWQQNYAQRLKAYEDNKKLANQEIEARNRTLVARGQTANQYSKLA